MTRLWMLVCGFAFVTCALASPFIRPKDPDKPVPQPPSQGGVRGTVGIVVQPTLDPSEAPAGVGGTPGTCPAGYFLSKRAVQTSRLVVCEVDMTVGPSCAAQPGLYKCGRDGSECCSVGTDNQCFSGSYACSPDGTGAGMARTACCISK